MSFGFGVGDFIAVGTLAWDVYRSCKGSAESFRNISGDVLCLHGIIKESEETLFVSPLPAPREARLRTILGECTNVLNDLEALVRKYECLGSKQKVTWNRMKWCKEDTAEIRSRLTSRVGMLTAFISISEVTVKSKLDKLVEDHQQGRRKSRVISVQSVDSLSPEDGALWRNIRKELEEIGITVAAFEANRDFILRWLSLAFEKGAFEEQNAPGLEDNSRAISPSVSTGSVIDVNSDTLSVDASAPSITCERCGKTNIAYELYMCCEQCKDGQYNLCLHCWRDGRGCPHRYGFGETALIRWDRKVISKGGDRSKCARPHFLTGRRYRVEQAPTDQGNRALIDTSKLTVELESDFFCSNCSALAQGEFWVCDDCNEGEWGYCGFCVRGGRCCNHPLRPFGLSLPSSTMSSIDSQSSEKMHQTRLITISANCAGCTLPIPSFDNCFHCLQCNEGDYDICIPCYLRLIEQGHISDENGPRGWRRCIKGHRMIIVRFEDSSIGQRRIISRDRVGGHISKDSDALRDSEDGRATKRYPPSGGAGMRVSAKFSNWPEEGESDELAFPRGAEIWECEVADNEWFWGIFCGRKGLFPRAYVEKIL